MHIYDLVLWIQVRLSYYFDLVPQARSLFVSKSWRISCLLFATKIFFIRNCTERSRDEFICAIRPPVLPGSTLWSGRNTLVETMFIFHPPTFTLVRFQLRICHCWYRYWPSTVQATRHCLVQCRSASKTPYGVSWQWVDGKLVRQRNVPEVWPTGSQWAC